MNNWKRRKKSCKKKVRQSQRTSKFVLAEDSEIQQEDRNKGYTNYMILCQRYQVK